MSKTETPLAQRIAAGDITLAVVGVGRVGLPLAIAFAARGIKVVGVDADPERVETVNSGVLPFIEDGAAELLPRVVTSGLFRATTDSKVIAEADVVILTVGTPLSAEMRADNSQLVAALTEIGRSLRTDTLVIARSTVSPGTTDRIVAPTLTRLSGLEVGRSLFVAFCPERISEGKALLELPILPEIVGGVDPSSTDLAALVFQVLNPAKTIHRTDALSAELAKLFTNVYRYVNFALANEYALIAEHYRRDAHNIISMLRDEYPRAPVPLPGPTGGPCLSKDGYFLIEELTFPDFVLTAWKVNESVPAHLVARLHQEMERRGQSPVGAKIAVLGRAFKADIDDDRMSPSLRLIASLERLGAEVHVHDPYIGTAELEDVLSGASAVVLATNHTQYRSLSPYLVARLVAPGCVVADAWALFDPSIWEAAGLPVIAYGRG